MFKAAVFADDGLERTGAFPDCGTPPSPFLFLLGRAFSEDGLRSTVLLLCAVLRIGLVAQLVRARA
jgi:hypothetical protein